MSRTKRRTSADRWWMKLEPKFEWVKTKCDFYYHHYKVPVSRKMLDLEKKREMEMDHGNWSPVRIYKEMVNESDRAKERNELYKIKESCYTGFDDVYDYDDSYEKAFQRSIIWSIW